MKIGLEVEFFGTQNGQVVNCRKFNIPSDEYPILAEARGQAFTCAFQAVGSVRAEIEKIVAQMANHTISPVFADWVARDKHIEALHEQILRDGLHKRVNYRNLFNLPVGKKNKRFLSAGLHVSFTTPQTFNYTNQDKQANSFTYNPLFDFPYLFNRITDEFKVEIKASERVPGFYEVKTDGRVEYRSLPATLIHSANFAARLNKCLEIS